MHLFYCPEVVRGLVQLPPEEAHHAASVLRLSKGERIGLLNGRGARASAELVEVSRKGCSAQVLEIHEDPPERAARIHLAIAPTKQSERIEWFVEKAVEIGVDRITLLRTHRTERDRLRMDRIERVAISAMKQSQRSWLPRIDPPATLQEVLSAGDHPQRYFGWCEGRLPSFMNKYDPLRESLVMIGPEGDFTREEAEQMIALGVEPVSLGNARLRTETAALAACTWMSLAQSKQV